MNIRIHSFNVSCAGLCCVLGSFFAADAREIYPLNGSWDFSFNGKPAEKVTVPHTWNAEDAANGAQGKREDAKSVNSDAYRRGPAVYSRTLPVEPRPGKRYFIRGGGASIVSEVSVNGKPAGSHEGAFTAFCYEITPLLKKGSNTISVLVDNTQRNHIAPQRGDFSMFGGLYRPIELIETDGVCIDPLFYASPGVFITTKSLSKSKAEVEVKTLLNSDGKAGDVDVAVEILDMKGRKVAGKTVKAAAGEKNTAFSPAFSSCVPGFSGGSLRPCRRRSSRLDAPRAKMPFRRPHRPAAPGRCLPLSAPLEAPGQGAGQPHGSNGSTPLSSTCAAYNRHSPEEGTGRFPCHSWHTSP